MDCVDYWVDTLEIIVILKDGKDARYRGSGFHRIEPRS